MQKFRNMWNKIKFAGIQFKQYIKQLVQPTHTASYLEIISTLRVWSTISFPIPIACRKSGEIYPIQTLFQYALNLFSVLNMTLHSATFLAYICTNILFSTETTLPIWKQVVFLYFGNAAIISHIFQILITSRRSECITLLRKSPAIEKVCRKNHGKIMHNFVNFFLWN